VGLWVEKILARHETLPASWPVQGTTGYEFLNDVEDVFLDPDEPTGYYVEEIIEGTTIVQALDSVQYDEKELKRQMKGQVDEAIKSDRMKPSEAMRLLDDYERGLKEYTYLSF